MGRSQAQRRLRLAGRSGRLDPIVSSFPGAAALILFIVVPLAIFAVYSVLTSSLYEVHRPFTLSNFTDALKDTSLHTLSKNSAIIGLLAAFCSVGLALPIAYWLRNSASRVLRAVVMAAVVASFLTGYLVRIYAFRSVLGRSGLVNWLLLKLHVIHDPIEWLLFSRFAVTAALVHIFLPYAVLTLYAAMGPLTSNYLEAAEDLGANAAQRWTRLIGPVMFGPALATFVLVFVLAAADYVTPTFLGGTSGATVGVQIETQFHTAGDYGAGAAIALLMLGAFLACYAISAALPRALKLNDLRFQA